MKNKVIVFDTNICINAFKSNLNENVIDADFFNEIKSKNKIAIFDMTLIECLMNFSRQNNIAKIRSFIKFIIDNNILIGKIDCFAFNIKLESLKKMLDMSDEQIIECIKNYREARFNYKSNIVALWILAFLQFFLGSFSETTGDYDKVLDFCNEHFDYIYKRLYANFIIIDENGSGTKNIMEITNKIVLDFVNIAMKYFKFNSNINIYIKKMEHNSLNGNSVSAIDMKNLSFYKYIYTNDMLTDVLDHMYGSEYLEKRFKEILNNFIFGKPLPRNDAEDMLMMTMLEVNNKITLVTGDESMREFMDKIGRVEGNEIYDKLIKKQQ